MVFGVAPFELLLDDDVRCLPKAFQIIGDLLGTVIRAEQMKLQRYFSPCHTRRLRPAVDFLDSHSKYR